MVVSESELFITKWNYGPFFADYVRTNRIFVWDDDKNDFVSLINVTYRKQNVNASELKDTVMNITVRPMFPFVMTDGFNDELKGFIGEVWTHVEDFFQFKSNKSFLNNFIDGYISVLSHSSQVLVSGIVYTDFYPVMMFSYPLSFSGASLFMKKPRGFVKNDSYLKTLSIKTWIIGSGLLIFTALLLWIFTNITSRDRETPVSFELCLLSAISGFCYQGSQLRPEMYSTRLLLFITLLFGYLLITALSTTLMSQLAVEHVVMPIPSLNAAKKYKTHSVCVRNLSYLYTATGEFATFRGLNETINPEYKDIVNGPGCVDMNVLNNSHIQVCKDNVVVFEGIEMMYSALHKHKPKCNIIKASDEYFRIGTALFFETNFKYRRVFNTLFLKMKSTGIMNRIHKKWIYPTVNNRDLDNPEQTSIQLNHISGVLIFYACFIIISLLILSFEYAFFNNMFNITSYIQYASIRFNIMINRGIFAKKIKK